MQVHGHEVTRKLSANELQPGMIVILESGSPCWTKKGTYVPFKITSVRADFKSITRETLDGYDPDAVVDGCSCDDRYHLYLLKNQANPNSNPKTLMQNALEFFRSMTASAEDKLLKKYGMENPIGTPTADGLALVTELLYKENRSKVIEIVTKLEAANDEKQTK